MDKVKVIKRLNQGLERELNEVVRYMHQSFWVKGKNAKKLRAFFREQSSESMDHATRLGEQIVALGGKTCFEKAWGVDPHNYLVCTQCQRVQSFSDPLVEAVRDKVSARLGFAPKFNRLEVYGLCDRCRPPKGPEDED